MTKKNRAFQWKRKHSDAFSKLKKALTESPVMTFFDTEKDTSLIVDAGPVGVSAVLEQSEKGCPDKRIIVYASRNELRERHSILFMVLICIYMKPYSH